MNFSLSAENIAQFVEVGVMNVEEGQTELEKAIEEQHKYSKTKIFILSSCILIILVVICIFCFK